MPIGQTARSIHNPPHGSAVRSCRLLARIELGHLAVSCNQTGIQRQYEQLSLLDDTGPTARHVLFRQVISLFQPGLEQDNDPDHRSRIDQRLDIMVNFARLPERLG